MDLHKVSTEVEVGNAVDQAIANEVDIISMSLGWKLDGPGDGTGFLGTVPAMSKAKTKIKVDEDFLPATYRWDAGDEEGSFTVSKETPGELMIVIEQDGSIGPIDKNTEVHQDSHIEIEDMLVEQDTVIE